MLMKKSGIYKIICLINNKIYVGSAYYLAGRKYEHFKYLRLNKHANILLQNAFNKYNENNFKFEIIEIVRILKNESLLEFKHRLVKREQYYFDTLNPYYNILKIAGSSLGHKQSLETIEKRRLNAKKAYAEGRRVSTWRGKPAWNRNIPQKEEVKEKIRNKLKGRKVSEYVRLNLIKVNIGRIKSTEEINKIRKANLGKKHSEETKKKLSLINKGKVLSQQTKNNIKLGWLKRKNKNVHTN